MKIRIIGSCGSGKSTLARKLSNTYKIPFYEIDNLIWDRSAENLKFPEDVRDAEFQSVIQSNSWILEGVQYKEWTLESIKQADLIFVLNPHVFIRDYRIVKRFILSRTGIRPWNYKQSFQNLRKMIIEWNHRYDVSEVIGLIKQFRKNPYLIKRSSEAIRKIEEHRGVSDSILRVKG